MDDTYPFRVALVVPKEANESATAFKMLLKLWAVTAAGVIDTQDAQRGRRLFVRDAPKFQTLALDAHRLSSYTRSSVRRWTMYEIRTAYSMADTERLRLHRRDPLGRATLLMTRRKPSSDRDRFDILESRSSGKEH